MRHVPFLLLLAACSAPSEHLSAPGALGPYSSGVVAGEEVFLSGKIGNEPGAMKLAPGGIKGETRQALENIKAAVERYGSTMDRVVKCTVFLADMAEWPAMNEVYVTFFPNNKPARSAVGATGLALNARVEIECIAAMK